MKKSKFTEQQIAFALRQAETGTKVEEIVRKLGITELTFYRWKRKDGGLGPSELRKLRQLEEENRKLKAMVADLSLDKAMLQEVIEKNFEGRSEALLRALPARSVSGQRAAGLQNTAARSFELSLTVDEERSSRSSSADSRARGSTRAIRLSPDSHPASAGRVQGKQAPCASPVSRRGTEPPPEATSTTCVGSAAN